jgi:hypothetical protein
MNTLQLRTFGKPTTAPELVGSEAPEPGARQVLVALEAAPINPSPVAATYPLEEYRDSLAHPAQAGRAGKVLFTW